MPPKAKLEIRIEVELPIGLPQIEKRRLEETTQAKDIDKTAAKTIADNISEILKTNGLIVKVDTSSSKKWFIIAHPSDDFIKQYHNKIETLF